VERFDGTPLSILIITNQDPTADWIQISLKELNYQLAGVVESVYGALQVLERARVDIILADSAGQGVLETEWIKNLAVQSAGPMVIVSAANTEMEFVRQAMLAGAQGFLLKPFDLSELHQSIQQVHQLALQRRAALAEVAAPDRAPAPARKAHSIAVFSPKGGTGATTLAVNLAIALKQQTKSPVLLIDADLRTADVDIFLSILSKHSIYNLMDMGPRIDEEYLERVLVKHASGISVLRGEPQLQLEIPIQPGQMSDLIEALIHYWDGYIVINTSDGLDRWTVEILDLVDSVLVVTTPELPALRATRNFLELADAAAEPGDKWQLIMSAYQGKKVLQISDIEASIHYRVRATIAEDIAAVSASINRGTPLMITHRKSPIAQDILALAKQLGNSSSKSHKQEPAAGKQPAQAETADDSAKSKRSFWRSVGQFGPSASGAK
jgi:pilus assembly protein CpaE